MFYIKFAKNTYLRLTKRFEQQVQSLLEKLIKYLVDSPLDDNIYV